MKLALGQVPPLVFVLFRLIGSLTLIAPYRWSPGHERLQVALWAGWGLTFMANRLDPTFAPSGEFYFRQAGP
jgi:hypothetical protein